MTRVAITGAQLVDPEASAAEAATLLIESGRLAGQVAPGATLASDWTRVARDGLWIAPGFIDLHFHGELVAAPPERFAEALGRAARRMPSEGTTAFLATSVCWPGAQLADTVGALAHAAEASVSEGATCLGLHLEGPWINPEAAGAMAPDAIRPFEAERDREVLERAGDQLRMVTLAPELAGAGHLLDELSRRGVLAALGHTRAGAEQIAEGIDRGLRHVTHLWNAMGPVHHREPGVAVTVLAEERLCCDLICDGHHVHPAILRLSARVLGDRLVLITDRVELSRADAEASALGPARAAGAGAPYRRDDGTLVGSQLDLGSALANLRRFAEVGLVEAVAACSLRPARLLGIESERGSLRSGARADLALLDGEGRVVETWLDGEPIWSAASA